MESYIPGLQENGFITGLDATFNGNLTVVGTTNIAAVSLTDLTTTGNTVIGNAVSDTLTINSATTVAATAGISSSVATLKVPFVPIAVQQAINANGAINLTTFNTAITSVATTGQTFTLADSTVVGQHKRIQMIVDDGDATVTFNTNATIVFADVGDVAELMWNGSDWLPIALYNCADGATAPAYTPAS